jgi:hypothetical protein
LDSSHELRFGSIEGAHDYLGLLQHSLDEAKEDIQGQTREAVDEKVERREKALRLVSYKLTRLEFHVTASRRLLNDLRTLRRLLFGERQVDGSAAAGVEESHAESPTRVGPPHGGPPHGGPDATASRWEKPDAP